MVSEKKNKFQLLTNGCSIFGGGVLKREDANSSLFHFMDELSPLLNHTKTTFSTKITKDDG